MHDLLMFLYAALCALFGAGVATLYFSMNPHPGGIQNGEGESGRDRRNSPDRNGAW